MLEAGLGTALAANRTFAMTLNAAYGVDDFSTSCAADRRRAASPERRDEWRANFAVPVAGPLETGGNDTDAPAAMAEEDGHRPKRQTAGTALALPTCEWRGAGGNARTHFFDI